MPHRSFRWILPLSLILIVICVSRAGAAPSAPADCDFEQGSGGWKSDTGADGLIPAAAPGGERQAACLRLANSDEAGMRLRTPMNLVGCGALRFDLLMPRSTAEMHVAVHLLDGDDCWYQSRRPIKGMPGKWQRVELSLDADAAAIAPMGHSRPWGPYVAREIKEVGIRVFADRSADADIFVDNLAFIPSDNSSIPPLSIFNYETSGSTVGQFGKFEITFELNRTYDNPFDPSQIDITGEFTTPSGEVVEVPGFFYQEYERRLDAYIERLTPMGSPKWKVRFCPREPGEYRYRVRITDSETVLTRPAKFSCVKSDDPGFIQVAEDWRYFERSNGDFFYPIGHNIPATFNRKASDVLKVRMLEFEGTYAYDRYLQGMAGAGENFARVWLASWSFGLEWSDAYHWAYDGLGRYNLRNAWRLDYVLQHAEKMDIYLQVALSTFGHWSTDEREGDWRFSPYNTQNGGPFKNSTEFWSNEEAQEIYQRMVRYVMARWGYSSHVAAWEVCNEIDLVNEYGRCKADIVNWHTRCAEVIQKYDPNNHLVTPNFADADKDSEIIGLNGISFSSTNHYRTDIVQRMVEIFNQKTRFQKPAIMSECGNDFHGSLPASTTRYIHISLWGSHMIPFAGSGMPWWWDFIDEQNLYPMFAPLAKFAAGEDRRGRDLNTGNGDVLDGTKVISDVNVITLQNRTSGYFWIYERRLQRTDSDFDFTPSPRTNVSLRIPKLDDGSYTVEFWDTWKGGLVSTLTATAKDGTLLCSVPEFTSDIAGKIKPQQTANPGK